MSGDVYHIEYQTFFAIQGGNFLFGQRSLLCFCTTRKKVALHEMMAHENWLQIYSSSIRFNPIKGCFECVIEFMGEEFRPTFRVTQDIKIDSRFDEL